MAERTARVQLLQPRSRMKFAHRALHWGSGVGDMAVAGGQIMIWKY